MSVKLVNTMLLIRRAQFTPKNKKIHTFRALGCTATVQKDANSKTTVDPEDVQHHTKLMKEWWDLNGPMKALHTYNLIRVPFIRDGLISDTPCEKSCTPLKGKSILDVGCGGGILSEPLAKLGAQVTGIDASCELIDLATKHSTKDPRLENSRPEYICTSIEEHAKSNEKKYDGVVASEIIEHVANPELFVKSCVRTLKPGGRIFFTTPNRTKLAEIGVIYLAEYVFKMVPKGTHQIDKFLTPTELTFLLERNNCFVELTHGLFYNFLTNRWSWSSYHHFAFALQAVRTD